MRRYRVAVLSLATILFILAAHFAILLVAHLISFDFGDSTGAGNTRLSLSIIVVAAATAHGAFWSFIYAGYADRRRDPLYWPLLVFFGAISLYLSIAAYGALDLLLHDLKPQWDFLNEPLTRLYSSALLATITLSMCWTGILIVGGRWRGLRPKTTGYLIVAVFLAALTTIVLLARGGI